MQTLIHEVECAHKVAVCSAPMMRYAVMLRRLPDHVLKVVCGVSRGDERAASLLIYLAGRIGWMLHEKESPALGETNEEQEDALARAGATIARDCAREVLRREGWLEHFSPRPDPFDLKWHGKRERCEMSAKGLQSTGERKSLLRAACQSEMALGEVERETDAF